MNPRGCGVGAQGPPAMALNVLWVWARVMTGAQQTARRPVVVSACVLMFLKQHIIRQKTPSPQVEGGSAPGLPATRSALGLAQVPE